MLKQKFSPKSTRERRASLRKKVLRVLVVENHSDTREGIQLFLKALGYHAVSTGTAREALAAAQRETFDLLLSDIALPDGDGWKLLTTLRERGQEPRHSVAMSGLNGPVEQARSREAGYKAHLVKPFAPQDLERVLHQVADNLAPLVMATAPALTRQKGLRQRLHDGLCQQLAASSLLQAALINRLEALDQSPKTTNRVHDAATSLDKADLSLAEVVGEARRIGELIHEALDETRAVMQVMEG